MVLLAQATTGVPAEERLGNGRRQKPSIIQSNHPVEPWLHGTRCREAVRPQSIVWRSSQIGGIWLRISRSASSQSSIAYPCR